MKILQDAYEQLNDCAVEQALKGRNIIDDLPSFYSKDGEQTEVSRMLRVMNEQYNTTVVLIDSLNDRTFPTFWDNRLLSDLVRQYILGRSMPDTEAIISEENYKIEKDMINITMDIICRTGAFLMTTEPFLLCPCLLPVSMRVWPCRIVL